ncbi:hypothetical protein Ancab_030605 [Ancistrocladus abbreviatus]
MSSKSPVFPMPEPQHFSDYGFDPQIDYFQVLEEARKHKREMSRSIDTFHFKLQKPISKDDSKKKKKKKRYSFWWKNALLFFKSKWAHHYHHDNQPTTKSRPIRAGSISGPIYVTESISSGCCSGSSTPYRTTSLPSSGPLAGTMTPTRKGDIEVPYFSLRDLNMDQPHRISASSMPIYLVT